MERKIYLAIVTSVTVFGVAYLGSCSADYEEPEFVNLGIEEQIMRVKKTSPEFGVNTPPYAIPVNENECALFALTAVKGQGSSAWPGGDDTASNYYNKLRDYAINKLEYTGNTAMGWNTILEVGKHFGLLEGMASFMTSDGRVDTFAAERYFSSSDVKNIKIINIENHTAKFKSYDPMTRMVKYYDANGGHKCHVTKIMSVMY